MAIQQTNKRWKLLTLLGSLAVFIGVVWFFGLILAQWDKPAPWFASVGLVVSGVFARWGARIGKWWTND